MIGERHTASREREDGPGGDDFDDRFHDVSLSSDV
jgi:hypothetical protein